MDSKSVQLVCRTCLKVINENELYINADTETKYGNLIDILEICFSELNLDISDGIVMCSNCITMLKIAYEFKLKCLNIEYKIFDYQKQHDLPIFSKVNLADVVNNFKHLENSLVDLSSEQNRQNENVEIDGKETAESIIPNHDSLDMTDMNSLKEDNSFEESDDSFIDYGLYESPELSRTENLQTRDYKDDVSMFDDLTNSDVNNVDNCRIISVKISEAYRNTTSNIETVSPNQSMDWDIIFERCRLNSSSEEHRESLFEIPPCNTTAVNGQDDTITEFVFRSPLPPNPKRKEYCPYSF